MKKLFLLFIMFLFSGGYVFSNTALSNSGDVIYTIQNGTTLKCTAKRINGSIDDYIDTTDYYYFKDDKIYSPNLITLYGNINKSPKKVLRLKITDDEIKFKDRLCGAWVSNYKWATINRHTGEYKFNAKRDFGTWYRQANAIGTCEVVEN